MRKTIISYIWKKTILKIVTIIVIGCALFSIPFCMDLLVHTVGIPLDSITDWSSIENKLVYYDVKLPVTSYTKIVNEIRKTKDGKAVTIEGSGYVVFDMDMNCLFAVRFSNDRLWKERMDRMVEDTWAWFQNEQSELSHSSIPVYGIVKKLEGNGLDFFREAVSEIATPESMDIAQFYYIDVEERYPIYLIVIWGIYAAIACGLVFLYVIRLINGLFRKGLDSYLRQNILVLEGDLEEDFRNAKDFSNGLWVGRRFTFYISFEDGVKVEKNRDFLQMGSYRKKTSSVIKIVKHDKTEFILEIPRKKHEEVLNYYSQLLPLVSFD